MRTRRAARRWRLSKSSIPNPSNRSGVRDRFAAEAVTSKQPVAVGPEDDRLLSFSPYRIPVKIIFAPVSVGVIESIFPWKKYG